MSGDERINAIVVLAINAGECLDLVKEWLNPNRDYLAVFVVQL